MWWSFEIVVILDYGFTSFVGSASEAFTQMDPVSVVSFWKRIAGIFIRVRLVHCDFEIVIL
jgi:hypothetical protein